MPSSSTNKNVPADKAERDAARNADPLSDQSGAHPVGVGLGAAAGGAAAGAMAGALGGPVGAVVGAVAGAVAGGYAGKAAAETIDPTVEDAYWRDNYRKRPYYEVDADYDQYQPAYQYGWESRRTHAGRSFNEVEPQLATGWNKAKSKSKLTWDKAKHATRDAWDRLERAIPGDSDRDGK